MKKAWIVSVNMGYGHQRTAFPLKPLAFREKIINANDYSGIPEEDKRAWATTQKFYEFITRFKRIPLIGGIVFFIFDQFQKILNFYPRRDMSKPNFQLKQTLSLIKNGWGEHLIKTLQRSSGKEFPPFLTAFFTPAFMAEYHNYPGEIFCIVCDADISRTWAPINPQKSRIKYLAPTERVIERLKLYGVSPQNVFLTGYPLPLENITKNPLTGGMDVLKEDLRHRILNLDPKKEYFEKYEALIEESLGKLPEKPDHPLTIMFAVGGAGAQKEIGVKIVCNLLERIKSGEVRVILVAGIRKEVKECFLKNIEEMDLKDRLDKRIEVLFAEKIEDYFKKFNLALRKTDILWTKPSELSFYSALGLPIVIAPTIGSQEEFNKRWLLKSGFGLLQEKPAYVNQWLFDWLDNGYLAECAMEGFIEGEKMGTLNIRRIVEK
jgi:hypothetical protein